MRKMKRMIAGIMGFVIIFGLLAVYDGACGDPVSKAYAKRQAVTYAEKLYPGQTFKVTGVLYDSPFVYRMQVQSEESRDTHFEIVTRYWTDTSDKLSEDALPEHERLVESRWNTCYRLGAEAAGQAELILQNELPELEFIPLYYGIDQNTVEIDLCFSEENVERYESSMKYSEYLILDQDFDSSILKNVSARCMAAISWRGTPTEEDLQKVLGQIKNIMEANEMPMAYYNVTLTPENGTYDEVRENMIESGNVASANINTDI
ncbi:MAG: hypothetical protein Q4F83_13740 [Eubacteriales bacterium]|nr:hypothetical protein [Eubacteriales bacterium]